MHTAATHTAITLDQYDQVWSAFSMQRCYSIYQAKARLSELIRAVKRSQRVTIMERGTPVAEVIPYERPSSGTLKERLLRLESAGALARAEREPRAIGPIAARPGALERFLRERA